MIVSDDVPDFRSGLRKFVGDHIGRGGSVLEARAALRAMVDDFDAALGSGGKVRRVRRGRRGDVSKR